MAWLWRSQAISFLQVPMHPFLLLLCFNIFSTSTVNPWLVTAANLWGKALKFSGPLFIGMEGMSSLLVAQKVGQEGKKLVDRGETYQLGMLIAAAAAYVTSAWWIVVSHHGCFKQSYPTAAASPLSSTLLGVALTAFLFPNGHWIRPTADERHRVVLSRPIHRVQRVVMWL
ncbi:hypothetical protein FA13DRAFT_1449255 [Coprinellus micaceus]|uniref:Uncharacterized protein n=1 Tax=Coprinellus micaceus TaxID=71717 RepID=A0A4Y7TNS7_COPMI|nr:hypothetical protein FA13DRAFT_1449255 [Coprinellus micaceus]